MLGLPLQELKAFAVEYTLATPEGYEQINKTFKKGNFLRVTGALVDWNEEKYAWKVLVSDFCRCRYWEKRATGVFKQVSEVIQAPV